MLKLNVQNHSDEEDAMAQHAMTAVENVLAQISTLSLDDQAQLMQKYSQRLQERVRDFGARQTQEAENSFMVKSRVDYVVGCLNS